MPRRPLLLLPILLLTVFQLNGETGAPTLKGVSLESRFYGALYNENDLSASKWDVTFMPTLHYRTEGDMEMAPYLLVRYQNESDPDSIRNSNPEIVADLNRLSFGMGCGLYWNFVDAPFLKLISGFRPEFLVEFPQWGDNAPTGIDNIDPGIGALAGSVSLPLGFEFGPWGPLRVRLWLETLRFNARWDEEYYRDDIIDRTITFYAESPFWSGDARGLSFSLLFGL